MIFVFILFIFFVFNKNDKNIHTRLQMMTSSYIKQLSIVIQVMSSYLLWNEDV